MGGGGAGVGGWGWNQNSMPDRHMRYNTNIQLSTQCRACGTVNISKYVINLLTTNSTTLILSSLVNDF